MARGSVHKVLAVLAGIALLGLIVVWIGRGPLAMAAYRRTMERSLGGDPVASLPDGLHVGLCGAGAPLPDPNRNGPCTVVVAGQRVFIIDAGDGAAKGLTLMGLPPARAEALLLTHFHSDHIDGLGGVMLQHWAGGAATEPLTVYGPVGVEEVVGGFHRAYAQDKAYRVAHHGPTVVPPSGFGATPQPFSPKADGAETALIQTPDLRVTAFAVDHSPAAPAVGYKIVYKGRSVVISGDTAPSPHLVRAAKNADVLVHEALSEDLVKMQQDAAREAGRENLAAVFRDIPGYHTTPVQAAELAERAGVRWLLLTHIVPGLPVEALEGPFLNGARSKFKGQLRLGRDGDFLSMPAGTATIRLSKRTATHR